MRADVCIAHILHIASIFTNSEQTFSGPIDVNIPYASCIAQHAYEKYFLIHGGQGMPMCVRMERKTFCAKSRCLLNIEKKIAMLGLESLGAIWSKCRLRCLTTVRRNISWGK